MRDGTNLVTTVTAIFKTLFPQRKSINQPEKTLWNKGLNFAVYKSYVRSIKTYNICTCSYSFQYVHVFVIMFSYICSVAHILTLWCTASEAVAAAAHPHAVHWRRSCSSSGRSRHLELRHSSSSSSSRSSSVDHKGRHKGPYNPTSGFLKN